MTSCFVCLFQMDYQNADAKKLFIPQRIDSSVFQNDSIKRFFDENFIMFDTHDSNTSEQQHPPGKSTMDRPKQAAANQDRQANRNEQPTAPGTSTENVSRQAAANKNPQPNRDEQQHSGEALKIHRTKPAAAKGSHKQTPAVHINKHVAGKRIILYKLHIEEDFLVKIKRSVKDKGGKIVEGESADILITPSDVVDYNFPFSYHKLYSFQWLKMVLIDNPTDNIIHDWCKPTRIRSFVKPFKARKICVSSVFGQYEREYLNNLIYSAGGRISQLNECNILICEDKDEADYKNLQSTQNAVLKSWITISIKMNKLAPFDRYEPI